MRCIHVEIGNTKAIVSVSDFDDLRLDANGRSFRFNFDKMWGPKMIGKRGNEIDALPPQRSPFWDALQQWCLQGHQVTDDGVCVYVPAPPEPEMVQIIGRHYAIVPPGRTPEDVRAEWLKKVEDARARQVEQRKARQLARRKWNDE